MTLFCALMIQISLLDWNICKKISSIPEANKCKPG